MEKSCEISLQPGAQAPLKATGNFQSVQYLGLLGKNANRLENRFQENFTLKDDNIALKENLTLEQIAAAIASVSDCMGYVKYRVTYEVGGETYTWTDMAQTTVILK